jgi:polyhydroxybutyrate depolymerase
VRIRRVLNIVAIVLAVVIGVPALFITYLVVRVKLETRHDLSMVSSGVTRTYQVYVPASLDAKTPVPLVISLHAAAGWPQLQRDLSQWDRVADEKGFIVAYPRGGNSPSTWNVDRGGGLDRDVRFIAELIDTISAHHAIDLSRVYANGLSNGGGMSFVLACKLRDRIAAVGIVSGAETLPFDWCTDPTPVPALIMHGVKDKIVPYAGGPLGDPFNPVKVVFPSVPEFAASWAKKNGCADVPNVSNAAADVIRREYVQCMSDATVDFYTITDGGHQWPGGEPLPQWWVGPFTSTVNTSELLWDFFARHSRRDR